MAVSPVHRLKSLDALRGFDMFWIMGAESIVHALASWVHWPPLDGFAHQFEHVAWNGFVFYDLIFPLFLFMAGVSMPYSLGKKMEAGAPRRSLALDVIRRGLTLVLFGIIYNNGIFATPFEEMRFPSVLGRIGLAYMLAGLIFIYFPRRAQYAWTLGILLGYWALMALVPVPGFGAGVYTQEGSLVAYIDRALVPGKLYLGNHDPEGLFSTLPAIATALLGAAAGWLLREGKQSPARKAQLLLAFGLGALALGWAWNFVFPVNKNLWTSSFVLVAGGWSLVLLALFYFIIDVRGWERWSFFFRVIGMNSITIYMAPAIIDFGYTADQLFNGILGYLPLGPREMMWGICFVGVKWLFLYLLYRQKWFLRV